MNKLLITDYEKNIRPAVHTLARLTYKQTAFQKPLFRIQGELKMCKCQNLEIRDHNTFTHILRIITK